MTISKNALVIIVLAAVVALGIVVFAYNRPVVADGGGAVQVSLSFNEIRDLCLLTGICKQPAEVQEFGAAAGPEDTFTDRAFNGRRERNIGSGLTTGTSTVFSVQSPTATSTPSIFCNVEVASSSATIWTIAESTGGFATTTVLNETPIAADTKGTFGFSASSTVTAPNTTLIVSVKGGVSGEDLDQGDGGVGFAPKGTCSYQAQVF